MAGKMVSLRIEPELLARIDEAVGGGSRTEWMVRALESALSEPEDQSPGFRKGSGGLPVNSGGRTPPASSRAPGPTRVDSVDQARVWMAERQARLNRAREKAS
jgi:hypothetical protein